MAKEAVSPEKKISVRLANKADIDDLLSLASLADHEDGMGRVPQTSKESLTRAMFAPGSLCGALVADMDGPIVGVAHYHQFWPAIMPRPTLALDDLFVIEDYRDRGVGRLLIQELCRLAVEFDCEQLDFTVIRKNKGALKFYRKLGAVVFTDIRYCRYNRDAMEKLAEEAKEAEKAGKASEGAA